MRIPHLTFKLKIFSFGLPSTFITLLLVPLFVYLGCWQLSRFEEKKRMQMELESRINEPIMHKLPQTQDWTHYRYRQLTLQGIFLNHYSILIENQIFKGQAGYRVLTPFLVSDTHKICLVDRGWIPTSFNPQQNILIPPIEGNVTLSGTINLPTAGLQLKEKSLASIEWPLKLSRIEFSKLSQIFLHEVYAFILQLPPQHPYGFQMLPITFNTPASRHLGYAIQWFAMAIAVFIYYLAIHYRHQGSQPA